MIKALIFDVDGTLAETEEHGHRRAFNHAFKQLGFDDHWSQDQYRLLLKVAGGKERIQHYWQSISHPQAKNKQLIAQLHQCKTQHYTELVTQGEISLRPGVEDLLVFSRQQGITLAIATTTSRINIETLLAATLGPDAMKWFDAVGCAENAPVKKPAPDVYQWVLEQLKIPAEQVIAFEDNLNGLQSANTAGISKVVITPTFLSNQEDFCDAWHVLEDLSHFDRKLLAII